MMLVHLGQIGLVFAPDIAVDALGRDPGVADGRRQQVRLDHVAANEDAGPLGRAIVRIGGGCTLAIVDELKALEVRRPGRWRKRSDRIRCRARCPA